jgi:hypothetical protein
MDEPRFKHEVLLSKRTAKPWVVDKLDLFVHFGGKIRMKSSLYNAQYVKNLKKCLTEETEMGDRRGLMTL